MCRNTVKTQQKKSRKNKIKIAKGNVKRKKEVKTAKTNKCRKTERVNRKENAEK